MTLFYRGPCAIVTHEVFVARCPSYQTYAIRELHQIHTVTETMPQSLASSTAIRVGSTAFVAASALVATSGWFVLGQLSLSLVATAALLLSAWVSAWAWQAYRRPKQLWAIYRGDRICIFSTPDQAAFAQVKRALTRVLERAGGTGPADEAVSRAARA